MVMKYFEELERNGYRYRNPEASDAPSKERRILDSIAFLSNHVHMPDGTPRYFPVIYERAPQYKEGRLEYVKVTVDSVGPSLSNQRYNVRIKIRTLPTHYTDDEIKKMDDLAKSVANASIERLAEILKIATVESVGGTFNHSFENVENGDVVMLKSVGQEPNRRKPSQKSQVITMEEPIRPLYRVANGINVEYTALARKLGLDELLTPDAIRDTVHSGFRRLGVKPDSVDLDGLKIKVGFAAGFHDGQATYNGNGTIYLGAYRLLSDKVPTRVLNMPDGQERADRYFSVVFTAGTTEAREHFGQLLDEQTLSKLRDDITYVFGDISLDDFDIRHVESTLAHEINHYMRPRNKRIRDLYDIAFRETVGSVIGGVVSADSIDTQEVIKEASKYGYERAREQYRPKPKLPPTLPEDIDIPSEERVRINDLMRKDWKSQKDEPEFPQHLRRYCNRVARYMADILLLGDEETNIQGLNASSLRELERISTSLPKYESEKELVALT